MLIYVLLAPGFVLLVKGADFLVHGASSIARRLRVSDLVIGLTVVAFGTSAPEFVVNIVASVEGTTGIAIGNVLGSNIFNILVILGISSLLYPLTVTAGTVRREIPLSLLAAVLLGVLVSTGCLTGSSGAALTRAGGVVLVAAFGGFLYYIAATAKKQRIRHAAAEPAPSHAGLAKAVLLVGVGLVMLNVGAKLVVDGAVELAAEIGVSQTLVGLTLVAVGTSLPELATSVTAALRKNADIAVGNIVGSNVFNILWILGVSALIRPLPFTDESILDVGMVICATALLLATMFTGKKGHVLERWEGGLFLAAYGAYVAFLMYRG
ncbi:MAG: calcium/sodium antiporter [Candidatus Thermoplasmatota archaeon]|nr:calcium/sodium antiporter [Candidatus Thermoplasmatota archaeon]MDD5777927.1 calcium/sodium antiporter [Candidatus Thermoplasmatota archaeon]